MMTGFAFYLSVMGLNYGGYATGLEKLSLKIVESTE